MRFLRKEQSENDITENDAIELIHRFEPSVDSSSVLPTRMSMYGFSNMLLSEYGDIFNRRHRKVINKLFCCFIKAIAFGIYCDRLRQNCIVISEGEGGLCQSVLLFNSTSCISSKHIFQYVMSLFISGAYGHDSTPFRVLHCIVAQHIPYK